MKRIHIEDKKRARWDELFTAIQTAEWLDSHALYEQALPCLHEIYPREPFSGPLPIGSSRAGGSPDLPRGLTWPVHDGKVMTFLAQVNLNELESDFAPYLPQNGWLYFFLAWDENAVDTPHQVLYFDGSPDTLQPTCPPTAARPLEKTYQPHRLRFEPGFTLSAETFSDMYAKLPKDKDSERVYEHLADIFQPEGTRLGGHPCSIQEASEQFAYMKLSGLSPAEFRKDHALHSQRMRSVRPLFVLNSQADMRWGDLGLLQFFIHEEALAKHDFSQTVCELIQ
jgi:uncharacterized protein YwqG